MCLLRPRILPHCVFRPAPCTFVFLGCAEGGGFKELLESLGLTVSVDGPGDLRVKPAALRRSLSKALANDEQASKTFLGEFSVFVQEHVVLRNCLLPLAVPNTGLTLRDAKVSLVRILLDVDRLQPRLINSLLERLLEFSVNEVDSDAMEASSEASCMPRLILNQLRHLDRVVNPQELARKMFEMADNSPMDVQREIITCLPDVIDDRAAACVTEGLEDMLKSKPELTVPILDAMSSLSLEDGVLVAVRDHVLEGLDSYEADAMPVVVKFILQSVDAECANAVVSRLRQNLALDSLSLHALTQGEMSSSQWCTSSSKMGESITLDAIKAGIRFQKITCDAWIKAIQDAKTAADHKAVDIFVLLMLHDIVNLKKQVNALVIRKIKAACFTAQLVAKTFELHGAALKHYFKPLLSIAELLMRNSNASTRAYSGVLYSHMFQCFDAYEQQEVVGALVTHVGSSDSQEVDQALSVLDALVRKHPVEMEPFFLFLKGMLDYIDNLAIHHTRVLFHMLSVLSTGSDGPDGSKADDLHIFIRKMLSKNTLQDKRVGVIGATMMIRALTEDRRETVEESMIDRSGSEEQAMSMLKLLRDQVLGDAEDAPARCANVAEDVLSASLLYDELASICLVNSVALPAQLLGCRAC